MSRPVNMYTLATHPSPYPHYHELRENGALRFDSELQLWVATSAEVVQAILESPVCTVRPPADKIPANIGYGKAGEIFGHLIRMNEGQTHQPAKQVLQTSLQSIDFSWQRSRGLRLLQQLAGDQPLRSAAHSNSWIMAFPISLVAHLYGFSDDKRDPVVSCVGQFVAALSPLSTAEQIQQAHQAAVELQANFTQLLRQESTLPSSFLSRLQAEAELLGWNDMEAIISNLIGLLSQTYEATAGLIGNSLVTLHRHPELRQELTLAPELMKAFIAEVVRYDPPVQNTRRFVTQDVTIAGQQLRAGEVILLLLAAANRDPEINRSPDAFLMHRDNRRSFTFSHARHQCPGQQLALSLAEDAVSYTLTNATPAQWQVLRWQYRSSMNGRIPQFCEPS